MANIAYLTSADFVVMGSKQKTLGINARGNVLVYFKMNRDPNCEEFDPIFSKLTYQEQRVTHAVLDVTQHREVVQTSRDTTTPITAVPVLILYMNGRPLAKFSGNKNIPSIQGFITKALQASMQTQAQPSQTFMPQQAPSQSSRGGKTYAPDIGAAPSMKGIIKGAGRGGYANGNNVEDDDEPRLMIPDNVIPHNAPWEAEMIDG